jgi:hypothetical protein
MSGGDAVDQWVCRVVCVGRAISGTGSDSGGLVSQAGSLIDEKGRSTRVRERGDTWYDVPCGVLVRVVEERRTNGREDRRRFK